VAKTQVLVLTSISGDATVVKEETWLIMVTCCSLMLTETPAEGSFFIDVLASLTVLTKMTHRRLS
jgi:hypothetical protein